MATNPYSTPLKSDGRKAPLNVPPSRGPRAAARAELLPKARSGIAGLDEITAGGLPAGRPTLVCGAAGSGKTMLAIEFLVRGAMDYGEPGVLVAFEETADDLAANVRSLGFDLKELVAEDKLRIEYVHIERSEIEETGEYDLEGLFIRLSHAVASIGAKRVALDTLEALFAGLPSHGILRAELRRLFRWLKDHKLTAVITGERDGNSLTRYGLEEFVADCVILLDHRIDRQLSMRRLRIVKYRGSAHGTDEYPFLIGTRGLSILPITSLALDHAVSTARLSSGVPALDEMLGAKGFYRGSSVLVTGAAGTGKSSLAMTFADSSCRRGERCLVFAYEESEAQILRNMRSIGLDLERWVKSGALQIHATRPTVQGLEQHLLTIRDLVADVKPTVVIIDPISNLSFDESTHGLLKSMLMRVIDMLKQLGITAMFTNLAEHGAKIEYGQIGTSSLMDTWIVLQLDPGAGGRTRSLYVLKSRGMAQSHEIRAFEFGASGIKVAKPSRKRK